MGKREGATEIRAKPPLASGPEFILKLHAQVVSGARHPVGSV